MTVLVTGAGGFLGRRVVATLADRGHRVRALVRRPVAGLQRPGVDVVVGDLRATSDLPALLNGVDIVVHLAAVVTGAPEAQFGGTVGTTENLLSAMEDSDVTRLVLCSSYAVYDWSALDSVLDEDSPVEADLNSRDGYANAKVWQERICRRAAERSRWSLTVLRPGYVWGAGADWVWGVGVRAGRTTIVVGSRKPLPLTHIENCADAFASVVEDERTVGGTYNVLDGHGLTPLDYARLYSRRHGGRIIVIPYRVVRAFGWTAARTLRAMSGRPARLPPLFDTDQFDARFKPLDHCPSRLCRVTGWAPPLSLEECVRLTFGGGPEGVAAF